MQPIRDTDNEVEVDLDGRWRSVLAQVASGYHTKLNLLHRKGVTVAVDSIC